MFKRIIIHLLLVVSRGTELQDKMFRNLLHLCPKQFVPENNDTETYNLTSGRGSCCTDNFHLSAQGEIKVNWSNSSAYGQTCLFPYLDKFQSKLQRERAFRIITQEPEGGCVVQSTEYTSGDLNRPTCNDSEVEPFRRFLLVYSNDSRLIYKSPQCAYCHGQFHFQIWDLQVSCPDTYPFSTTEKLCGLHFAYPGDIRDIEHLECFTDEFSACPSEVPNLFKYIPLTIEVTLADLEESCLMETLPSYTHHLRAKNVFCFLCHYGHLHSAIPSLECVPSLAGGIQRALGEKEFSRLLDPRLVMVHGDLKNEAPRNYCDLGKLGDNMCRPILCPLGEVWMKDHDGMTCQFESLRWTVGSKFAAFIQLQLDQHILVNDSTLERIFKLNKISNPWSNNWNVEMLYRPFARDVQRGQVYNRNISDSKLIDSFDHIYIKISYDFKTVIPRNFVSYIKQTMRKYWILHLGKSIRASQHFSPHTFREVISADRNVMKLSVPMWQWWTLTIATQYSWVYKHIVINNITSVTQSVNKLMFCENVELILDSVNVSARVFGRPVAISLDGINKTLFDNEFTTGAEFDTLQILDTFRVCLSDIIPKSAAANKLNTNIHVSYNLAVVVCVLNW